jgi:hypothetical protein
LFIGQHALRTSEIVLFWQVGVLEVEREKLDELVHLFRSRLAIEERKSAQLGDKLSK